MIIAADATTFARLVERKLAEDEAQRLEFLRTGNGIDDHSKYKHEVGYLAGLQSARDIMLEAAQELSGTTPRETA